MRIAGGTGRLIDRLMSKLGEGIVETNAKVSRIIDNKNSVTLHHPNGRLTASQAIVAVPPRIAVNSIDWVPELSTDLTQALDNLPTWMAPHAKVVIVYKKPFWRAHGLSGRIASRVGPLMEVHDHCSSDKRTSALFGFIGWPHGARLQHRDKLPDLIKQQLVKCLGTKAATPEAILIEDWSENRLIAQSLDLLAPQTHPEVGAKIVRQPIWNNRLAFAAAETASQSPGLIEGALVAAGQVVNSIQALSAV
ncbi:MAG: flavin monoamine oxidase family protein [Hyphomicrobiaceae bacterium]